MSKRSRSRGKKIKPQFWVFCEGETEEAYVAYLRSTYRIPIEIVSRVAGSSISERFIKKSKQGKPVHPKDRDFLLYDADVSDLVERLQSISATTLISNPSIELWFLLHYKNQRNPITEEGCIRELCNRNQNIYTKGAIDERLKVKLTENCKKACERAKDLSSMENPSSNVYLFIEVLEDINK